MVVAYEYLKLRDKIQMRRKPERGSEKMVFQYVRKMEHLQNMLSSINNNTITYSLQLLMMMSLLLELRRKNRL